MKNKLIICFVLGVSTLATASEYSTAYTARASVTYQEPAHFEHVFGRAEEYQKPVIEDADDLLDMLGDEDDGVENEAEVPSAHYLAWEKYCNNEVLTKDEYLIIDEGDIPHELKDGCKRKGKTLSDSLVENKLIKTQEKPKENKI